MYYVLMQNKFSDYGLLQTHDNRPALSFPLLSTLTPTFLSIRKATPLVLFGTEE